MSDRDWIRPGADVLCYEPGHRGDNNRAKRTTIAKVGKIHMTMTDPREPRYNVERLRSVERRHQGVWGPTRVVVPWDSPDAQGEWVKHRQYVTTAAAIRAVRLWEQKRTPELRQAAVAALMAVEDGAPPVDPDESPVWSVRLVTVEHAPAAYGDLAAPLAQEWAGLPEPFAGALRRVVDAGADELDCVRCDTLVGWVVSVSADDRDRVAWRTVSLAVSTDAPHAWAVNVWCEDCTPDLVLVVPSGPLSPTGQLSRQLVKAPKELT